LTVPASVTVPAGSFYAAYPARKQPVLNWTQVVVDGTFNNTVSQAVESVYVGQAVGSAPLPTLTVALTGKGKVVSAQRTINCGTVCSTTPALGLGWTEVLTATAGTGSVFSGWTGACSGTALTCSVIVNGLVDVGATFTALPGGGGGGGGAAGFKLTVAKANSGTVTSTPAGVNCGSTCTANYAAGNAVTLTATPPPGLAFLGWSGACSGTAANCTVTINADTKVQANFSK
jgi:endoglucanase